MKRAGWIVTAAATCVLAAVAVFAIFGATMKAIHPERPHPVCLISHRAVILIPTVCHDRHEDRNELCQRPIVAELCDSVEMQAH
jgi:hypothetical protein